jgi:hypothetical protein
MIKCRNFYCYAECQGGVVMECAPVTRNIRFPIKLSQLLFKRQIIFCSSFMFDESLSCFTINLAEVLKTHHILEETTFDTD